MAVEDSNLRSRAVSKEIRYAFESLMKQGGLTEHEMLACWLEFAAEKMRDLANGQGNRSP